jgi:general stress protein YciG
MFEPAEAHFRRRMRELAKRGGAATKRRAAADRNYYANIGRHGGRASVEARKAKIAAEFENLMDGALPTVESGCEALIPSLGVQTVPPTTESAMAQPEPAPTEHRSESPEQLFDETFSEEIKRLAEAVARVLID